jgi:homocitrate synthase NifV
MGVLHPLRTHRLFRQLCAETDLELEFRGHDHFGLATANTVAAIQGGATHVSVSLSRIDERLGTAQLSETAHAIRKSTMHHTRIELPRIDALATLVSAPTEHPNLPVRTAGMARALVADALAMICPAIPAAATRVGG